MHQNHVLTFIAQNTSIPTILTVLL